MLTLGSHNRELVSPAGNPGTNSARLWPPVPGAEEQGCRALTLGILRLRGPKDTMEKRMIRRDSLEQGPPQFYSGERGSHCRSAETAPSAGGHRGTVQP